MLPEVESSQIFESNQLAQMIEVCFSLSQRDIDRIILHSRVSEDEFLSFCLEIYFWVSDRLVQPNRNRLR